MTENEALKILSLSEGMKKEIPNLAEVYEVAVKALTEIQHYWAIGTVKECRVAVERMKPKKPITYKGTNRADCPNCGGTVRGIDKPFGDWCSKCGQALNWSE